MKAIAQAQQLFEDADQLQARNACIKWWRTRLEDKVHKTQKSEMLAAEVDQAADVMKNEGCRRVEEGRHATSEASMTYTRLGCLLKRRMRRRDG